jgi:hypothetical protein
LSVLAVGNLPLTYVSDSVDRRLVFVYALAFSDLPMFLDVVLLLSVSVVVMMVGMVGSLAEACRGSSDLEGVKRASTLPGKVGYLTALCCEN